MHLRTLTTDEFMRQAYTQMDPFTATHLEQELYNRLEQILTHSNGLFELTEELGGNEHSSLLKLLYENDLYRIADLERAIKLYEIVTKHIDEVEDLKKAVKLFTKIKELNDDTTAIDDVVDLLKEAQEII